MTLRGDVKEVLAKLGPIYSRIAILRNLRPGDWIKAPGAARMRLPIPTSKRLNRGALQHSYGSNTPIINLMTGEEARGLDGYTGARLPNFIRGRLA